MTGRILIVDDEKAILVALRGLFAKEGYQVETAASGTEALRLIETGNFHVVVTDLSMEGTSGMQVLERARAFDPDVAVVMITAHGSEKAAVQAMKLGAADYLPKPFDNDELRVVVRRAMEASLLRRDHRRLLEQVQGAYGFEQMVGTSQAMRRVFATIERVADTDVTVLIRGESGTGKELVANALHYRSPRRTKPLVKMNCAALSRELVESELFGHEKGAFTGAVARREGKFEAADGGTLLLDECGDMPLETQAKLLRALQEREIERVGTSRSVKINTRVVAASNVDLREMVKAGKFREDLFYRLNVVSVNLPPLRERPQDIAALAIHFVEVSCRENTLPAKTLSQAALQRLMEFDWPGNVRHLQNAVEHAVAMSGLHQLIEPDTLPDEMFAPAGLPSVGVNGLVALPAMPDEGINFASTMSNLERGLILRYLEKAGGNKRQAARLLNLSRTTLIDKLNRLGVTAEAPPPQLDTIRAIA
jgi:DNA-binding NtrC family response regulator